MVEALREMFDDSRKALVVVSTDLSHFLPRAQQETVDTKTLAMMRDASCQEMQQYVEALALQDAQQSIDAQRPPCNSKGVQIASCLREQEHLHAKIIADGNSPPANSGKDNPVGYGSVLMTATSATYALPPIPTSTRSP